MAKKISTSVASLSVTAATEIRAAVVVAMEGDDKSVAAVQIIAHGIARIHKEGALMRPQDWDEDTSSPYAWDVSSLMRVVYGEEGNKPSTNREDGIDSDDANALKLWERRRAQLNRGLSLFSAILHNADAPLSLWDSKQRAWKVPADCLIPSRILKPQYARKVGKTVLLDGSSYIIIGQNEKGGAKHAVISASVRHFIANAGPVNGDKEKASLLGAALKKAMTRVRATKQKDIGANDWDHLRDMACSMLTRLAQAPQGYDLNAVSLAIATFNKGRAVVEGDTQKETKATDNTKVVKIRAAK